MKIKLNNIGIVNNSAMELNGLTIITGENNSGKTTVGKVLYSLLDAVSNITVKAREDREQYISRKLDDIIEAMDLFRFFSNAFETENKKNTFLSNYPAIEALFSRNYRHDMPANEVEDFAHKVKEELSLVDIAKISNTEPIQYYVKHLLRVKNNNKDFTKIIKEQINKANLILDDLFKTINKDPQLVEYARESINRTLQVEFSEQIQPVNYRVEKSKIELYDDETCCFNVNIVDNRVQNNNGPVFFTSPYKKAFFIDNPFIFDNQSTERRIFRSRFDSDTEGILNSITIVSHNTKLKLFLRSNNRPTVLEQTIINESVEKIKEKIDLILPGTFEFSSIGDYYIKNGTKLKISNLATGSKMFSIIKILLERGELDQSTMLILDEPEAHLHPSWQNRFAEMIVLLVKELDVNILLTTHSSNFVLALDAYMRKYKIEEKTNFYRTIFNDNNTVDYVCTNDDIGEIYKDFLQYFSEVKMLRNECIKNFGE